MSKILIVEESLYGGTCANRGCNSKALLDAPYEIKALADNFEGVGKSGDFEVDWASLMKFKRKRIAGMSVFLDGKFDEYDLDVAHGKGVIMDEHTVKVGDETFTTEKIVKIRRSLTMRKGILCAGNMLVDITYPIEGWPAQGELVRVLPGIGRSTGGAVCNVIADLARLDPALPLFAAGIAGHDPEGDFILEQLSRYPNIDTSAVLRTGQTAFTLVMSNTADRQRTFFQYAGAMAEYGEEHLNIDALDCAILHIGYLLLLPHLGACLLSSAPSWWREYPEGRGASTLPQNNTLPESPYFARESLSPAEGYNYLPPEG